MIADEREVRDQILPSPITRAVEAGLGDGVDGAVEDDEHPRRRGEVEVQLGEVCGEADGSVRVDLALEADDVEPSLAPLLRDAAEVEDLALEEARLRCAEVLRKVACPASHSAVGVKTQRSENRRVQSGRVHPREPSSS